MSPGTLNQRKVYRENLPKTRCNLPNHDKPRINQKPKFWSLRTFATPCVSVDQGFLIQVYRKSCFQILNYTSKLLTTYIAVSDEQCMRMFLIIFWFWNMFTVGNNKAKRGELTYFQFYAWSFFATLNDRNKNAKSLKSVSPVSANRHLYQLQSQSTPSPSPRCANTHLGSSFVRSSRTRRAATNKVRSSALPQLCVRRHPVL